MATAAKKTETVVVMLPEGRLINSSLFEKDAYTDANGKEGTPSYKIELAFDPKDVTGDGTVEDQLANACADKWGEEWFDKFFEGKVTNPLLSGDKLAERRAEKGKEGDAYRGKIVIRANTTFNKHGDNGPGGVCVYGPDVSDITIANAREIYPGMYGQAAVTISTYLDNRGDKALKFYLTAFQKTRDGEKLVQARDNSTLFKKVAPPSSGEASASTGRRKRG